MAIAAGAKIRAADLGSLVNPWSAFTPVYNGITVGNGTASASYIQAGKTVHVRWRLVWGSTTSFSSTPQVGLPVTAHGDYGHLDPIGPAAMLDASAGSASRMLGLAVFNGGNVFFLRSGVTTSQTVVSNVPWVWATGDTIAFRGTYEAA